MDIERSFLYCGTESVLISYKSFQIHYSCSSVTNLYPEDHNLIAIESILLYSHFSLQLASHNPMLLMDHDNSDLTIHKI